MQCAKSIVNKLHPIHHYRIKQETKNWFICQQILYGSNFQSSRNQRGQGIHKFFTYNCCTQSHLSDHETLKNPKAIRGVLSNQELTRANLKLFFVWMVIYGTWCKSRNNLSTVTGGLVGHYRPLAGSNICYFSYKKVVHTHGINLLTVILTYNFP